MQEELMFAALMGKLGDVIQEAIKASKENTAVTTGMEGITVHVGQKAIDTMMPALVSISENNARKASAERDIALAAKKAQDKA